MYVITQHNSDDPLFDVLSENNGNPILFTSGEAAIAYISTICESFGIEPDKYIEEDNINICRMQ